ncbi:1-acyl-sn-glycerol-3-phosphate acyltransferase [Kitasatospora xanthocidica]|uniref:1-acyl-sn-glycerol-3-phosphate acyltransferase n=1 Tax=Kitasatospora xanthocidica TaxID=83382 RepID=A0A372ZQF1_9ACTN|nr:lysophospholipid acyltransferase family protein [Kitasatospora xanthocidica]RGD57794.1 1-acyl-sn-glycerol-3-phosphate acyltransferase [Kitasatospora xanthocidica]
MSVWLPTATCRPETCLADVPPRVSHPRRALRLTACLAAVLAGVVLLPPVRLLPDRARNRLARLWARVVLRTLGVTVHLAGPDGWGPGADGGVLVVANHVSWLDIPLLAAGRPGRSLAKTEVRRWPVLGPLIALGGTVFLDRDRLRTLPDTVATVAEVLRSGHPVIVFPEGSTWCGRESGRFRPALFQAAVEAGADVQPVTIRYRLADGRPTSVPAFIGDDGLLTSLARVVAARGLVADVTFLPPIPPPGPRPGRAGARRELARTAQAAVEGIR